MRNIFLAIVAIAVLVIGLASPLTAYAAKAFEPTQDACHKLSEDYANLAHPEDPDWNACFLKGWINWVFSAERPLPEKAPAALVEALKKGTFLQLTEPWRAGCDNTLMSPDCSIGYLKLFGDWGALRSFLHLGDFTQAGIVKYGPWSEGSLWVTDNYIQVTKGNSATAEEKNLFCSGALGWAFATDGEYPLSTTAPCAGDNNVYYLREEWRGGGIGDQLPDENVNVGKIQAYKNWGAMVKYLADNNWTRGSVWANRDDLAEMAGIIVIVPTAVPPTVQPTKIVPTATVQPTATKIVPTATTVPSNPSKPAEGFKWNWAYCLWGLIPLGLFLLWLLFWPKNKKEDDKPEPVEPVDPIKVESTSMSDKAKSDLGKKLIEATGLIVVPAPAINADKDEFADKDEVKSGGSGFEPLGPVEPEVNVPAVATVAVAEAEKPALVEPAADPVADAKPELSPDDVPPFLAKRVRKTALSADDFKALMPSLSDNQANRLAKKFPSKAAAKVAKADNFRDCQVGDTKAKQLVYQIITRW